MKKIFSLTLLTTILILGACGNIEQEDSQIAKEVEVEEESAVSEAAVTVAENQVNEEVEVNEASEQNSESIGNETDPLEIAKKLVEQEMAKQVGLEEWKITENNVTSDQIVDNIADYDKPVGEMRKLWVTGNVEATATDEEGGATGDFGYDLQLYQMTGDSTWYIGEHYGVLIGLIVTDEPEVDETGLELSDSEELPTSNAPIDSDETVEYEQDTEEYYEGF
ncbi:hypothetical protein [Paraliobacillus sediminis]|uniref:hypothetical protein n=1 Tax=Paraliobacillus sediminis TaxID=1885916 RepID=UPI000E3D856A|nr:hypothetical protein [Paraliobacillus sediminis]